MSWFGFSDNVPDHMIEELHCLAVSDTAATLKFVVSMLAGVTGELKDAVSVELDPKYTGIELWKSREEHEGFPTLRAAGLIKHAKPSEVLSMFWSDNLEKRVNWDPDVVSIQLVEAYNENAQLIKVVLRSNAPLVSDREFLVVRGFREETNGSIVYIELSVNRADVLVGDSLVRGVTRFSFIAEPTEEGTVYREVSYLNPKGWIPSPVSRLLESKPVERIRLFQSWPWASRKDAARRAALLRTGNNK